MKNRFLWGMSLALCLVTAVFTGCEKDKDKDKSYSENLGNGVLLKMKYVKGGTFQMGATSEQGSDVYNDERLVHSVTLSDFYMGETEVTQAQWKAVMGTTIDEQRIKAEDYWEVSWELHGVGDDYPMYYVSWEDAKEFCTKLSQKTGKKYRLPTEAEWEYAARGGATPDGTKYAGSNTIGEVAWCYGKSNGLTHPVGQKKANALGLYDMSGNVLEWCSDWYDNRYGVYGSSSVTNPQGPSSGSNRVNRGGSWSNGAKVCRVSCRNRDVPGRLYNNLGFRVVCEL